jgi:hypothetical protein
MRTTNINESKRLTEAGLITATSNYIRIVDGREYPIWTFENLLELLPNVLKFGDNSYYLTFSADDTSWNVGYKNDSGTELVSKNSDTDLTGALVDFFESLLCGNIIDYYSDKGTIRYK